MLAALTAAALVPVWLFRYFPTQDGPSHLYNAFVLARLDQPLIREFFQLRLALFPNWTTYLLMAPLTRVLPPLVVQQIVLSLCVIAIPAATLYLQKSFKEESDATVLLGAILSFSYLFFLGFFNFILAAALFAVTVGHWQRHHNLIVAYVLLAAAYLTHGLPFAAALLALAILITMEKRWRALLAMTPAFALFVFDALQRMSAEREWRSLWWHVKNLVALRPLVFFSEAHVWIAMAVFFALLCGGPAFLPAFLKPAGRNAPSTALGAGSAPLISLALLILFFAAPWGYGAGGWALGGWINDRFLFLALLTLPAWLKAPRYALPVATVLAVAHIGLTSFDIARESATVQRLAAVELKPHTTIKTLGSPGIATDRVTPAQHIAAYLALQDDVVNLDNYEARLRDFPVAFRTDVHNRAPDYLVIWRTARVRRVAGYKLLHEAGDMRVFGRGGL
jgi:hypothetical protein